MRAARRRGVLEHRVATRSGAHRDLAGLELGGEVRRDGTDRSRTLAARHGRGDPARAQMAAVIEADLTYRFGSMALNAPEAPVPGLPPRWVVRLWTTRVSQHLGRDEEREAQALWETLARAVEEGGADLTFDDRAAALHALGRMRFRSTRYAEAVALFERAAQAHEDDGNPASTALALQNTGNCLSSLGKLGDALRVFRQALGLVGDGPSARRSQAYVYANMSLLHERIGDSEGGARYAALALEQIDHIGETVLGLNVLAVRVAVSMRRGRLDEARAFLDDARRRLADSDRPEEGVIFEVLGLWLDMASGWEADRVERGLERLADLARGVEEPYLTQALVEVRARVLHRLGRHDQVVDVLRPELGWLVTRGMDLHPEPLYDLYVEGLARTGAMAEALEAERRRAALWRETQRALVQGQLSERLAAVEVQGAEARAREAREEARRLAAQLVRAQRIEGVGQLAAGLAHDFNNLLMVVMSGLDAAQADPGLGPDTREAVEAADHASERAAGVIRRLLTFARQVPVARQRVDLAERLADLGPMLQAAVGSGVRIDLELDAAVPAVHADPGLLDQAVLNLVLNARDAVGAEERVTLGLAHEGGWVCLRVSDTGCGMSEEVQVQARIFDPFYTTKAPSEGTGLGLSMVWGIVKELGGDILVDSAPGQGTTFSIRLPPVGATSEAQEGSQPPGAGGPDRSARATGRPEAEAG